MHWLYKSIARVLLHTSTNMALFARFIAVLCISIFTVMTTYIFEALTILSGSNERPTELTIRSRRSRHWTFDRLMPRHTQCYWINAWNLIKLMCEMVLVVAVHVFVHILYSIFITIMTYINSRKLCHSHYCITSVWDIKLIQLKCVWQSNLSYADWSNNIKKKTQRFFFLPRPSPHSQSLTMTTITLF